jgi:hypothetical protein
VAEESCDWKRRVPLPLVLQPASYWAASRTLVDVFALAHIFTFSPFLASLPFLVVYTAERDGSFLSHSAHASMSRQRGVENVTATRTSASQPCHCLSKDYTDSRVFDSSPMQCNVYHTATIQVLSGRNSGMEFT